MTHIATMIITSVETLRCGAGFRDFCFVKICTDGTSPDGKPIIGWSEYLEERNIGITQVIEWMGELVTGQDPLPFEKILSNLRVTIFQGYVQRRVVLNSCTIHIPCV